MPADLLSVRGRFSEILEAARTQDRSKQSATMVVLSHLQQMTLLMLKKGLFFYCEQDTYKARSKFLDDLIKRRILSFSSLMSTRFLNRLLS
jgi:hypothetical protein